MSNHFKRRRLILDGLLLLAVVLAIFSFYGSLQASAEPELQSLETLNSSNQDFGQPIADTPVLTETESTSNSVILANETIAAVIAAENAAIFLPHYLTNLPMITR